MSNVKSDDLENARLLGDAIRSLRNNLGLTQAQLAVKIGIAPTSIYRYESGLTEPDLRTIQKLFVFADKQQDEEAKTVFRNEIQDGGEVVITGVEGSTLMMETKASRSDTSQLRVGDHPLTPRERLLATAFVLMLRNNVDESSERMMKLLLEPWMNEARNQLKQ